MTFFQNHGEQVIQTMDEMSDFANQTVMTPTFLLVSIVFCFSTAVGAWGGFSHAPPIFTKVTRHVWVRYALLFVLVWQGGGSQNSYVSLFGTALFMLLEFLLWHYDRPLQLLLGFDPDQA
jgi:hypothetical protein